MSVCLPPDLVSQAINQEAGCICTEQHKKEEKEDSTAKDPAGISL